MAKTQRENVDTKIPHLNVEKAWENAKRLKEDLDKRDGWTRRYNVVNEYDSWSKTFPNDEVPVKLVYNFQNMPMTVEKFAEMISPKNMHLRGKWESHANSTTSMELVEMLSNGGCIVRSHSHLSFPMSDRDFLVYFSPVQETNDWFGKKAFGVFLLDATHPSTPAGADGIVRATNGGNFYIAVPDEKEPEHKCEALILSTNNYNGWLPKNIEWLVAKVASRDIFYHLRQLVINGYNEYFNN